MSKGFKDLSKRSYVATQEFSSDIFKYSTSMDSRFNRQGTLTAVGTYGQCPPGRILRENGRKLYNGINPGVNVPYMVGVFDNQTLISGFIDPNSYVFSVYNEDKPTYIVDSVDPALGATDHSASVYTNGLVQAIGNITTTAGNVNVTNGVVQSSGNLITTAGKLVVPSSNGSSAVGTATLSSGTVTVLSTQFNPSTSKVFLTYGTSVSNAGILYYTTTTGGFIIRSSNGNDGSSVNWFIVN